MKVLFICTGNVCRSPAAEYMLRHLGGSAFESRSRGTAAPAFSRISDRVYDFLTRMGITGISHRPQLVMEADINWADLILVMENRHFEEVAEKFPHSLQKMHLFLEHCFRGERKELPDPMGAGDKIFEETLITIRKAVEELVRLPPDLKQ